MDAPQQAKAKAADKMQMLEETPAAPEATASAGAASRSSSTQRSLSQHRQNPLWPPLHHPGSKQRSLYQQPAVLLLLAAAQCLLPATAPAPTPTPLPAPATASSASAAPAATLQVQLQHPQLRQLKGGSAPQQQTDSSSSSSSSTDQEKDKEAKPVPGSQPAHPQRPCRSCVHCCSCHGGLPRLLGCAVLRPLLHEEKVERPGEKEGLPGGGSRLHEGSDKGAGHSGVALAESARTGSYHAAAEFK